jgi:hypothetical protein
LTCRAGLRLRPTKSPQYTILYYIVYYIHLPAPFGRPRAVVGARHAGDGGRARPGRRLAHMDAPARVAGGGPAGRVAGGGVCGRWKAHSGSVQAVPACLLPRGLGAGRGGAGSHACTHNHRGRQCARMHACRPAGARVCTHARTHQLASARRRNAETLIRISGLSMESPISLSWPCTSSWRRPAGRPGVEGGGRVRA